MFTTNDKIAEFNTVFGHPVRTVPELNIPERQLKLDLIKEEFNELLEASANDDFVGMADAWGDLIVVIYGAAQAHGVDLDAVVNEIHRSNMTKLGEDGKPIYRESDGKIMKGPNYEKPVLAPFVVPANPIE